MSKTVPMPGYFMASNGMGLTTITTVEQGAWATGFLAREGAARATTLLIAAGAGAAGLATGANALYRSYMQGFDLPNMARQTTIQFNTTYQNASMLLSNPYYQRITADSVANIYSGLSSTGLAPKVNIPLKPESYIDLMSSNLETTTYLIDSIYEKKAGGKHIIESFDNLFQSPRQIISTGTKKLNFVQFPCQKNPNVSWAIGFSATGLIYVLLTAVDQKPGSFRGQLVENWQYFAIGGVFILIGVISAFVAIRAV